MTAYYNEIDPKAAAWLRELIRRDLIAPGDVDTRSIEDVSPDDLRPYTQCHFFAGIGVWSYALRLAGWPDDRPVWTGSCPCGPFSAAGKGRGFADERHLWPAFFHLIKECRPGVVLGEQVASKDGLAWLDLVRDDLEGEGYAVGAIDTCSAGFGAPHIRQRLRIAATRVEHAPRDGRVEWRAEPGGRGAAGGCGAGGVADTTPEQHDRAGGRGAGGRAEHTDSGSNLRLADAANTGQFWRRAGEAGGERDAARLELERLRAAGRPGPVNGFWRAADWLFCRDGRWRPVEPGSQPLVDGAPARMGFVCAACAQIDEKNTDDENLHALPEITSSFGGCMAEEVLQSCVHGEGLCKDAENERGGALPSAAAIPREAMRGLREDRAVSTPSSQRREPDEQFAVEYLSPLCGLPLEGTREDTCDACGRKSLWLAEARLGGNRSTRLRGYGNAVDAIATKEFIEAAVDAFRLMSALTNDEGLFG